MQVVHLVGKIGNQCKRRHLVAKFATNSRSFTVHQFQTILVERFTQVMDSIPWVRCASGNVFKQYVLMTVSDVKINPSHSVPSQVLCQEGLLMESSLIELNV